MTVAIASADRAEIHAIATRAIVDPEFQAAVLNGHRRESLEVFKLTEVVAQQVLQIKAENLQDFIRHLSALAGQDGKRLGGT